MAAITGRSRLGGKFTNQDRSFHGRLRLWKEGWWQQWTPQIVLGANDPGSHESAGGGDLTFQDVGESTNHLTRFYVAATKHFTFEKWGTLGLHASVIQFDGLDFDNEHGVTVGINYRFNRTEDDFWNKALNGLNLMGEYYDGVWNVGTNYSVWKDRINVVAALYDNRFFVCWDIFQSVLEVTKYLFEFIKIIGIKLKTGRSSVIKKLHEGHSILSASTMEPSEQNIWKWMDNEQDEGENS